ncbi:hypothetical protein [Solitalea lacus]|uniref:hypothetical protein n=1 Tax=Solitalea lacus TaxID=2911172 RepID=UPI001EDADB90|nr:hypothetical protein [Solitalea lacus]UKJ06070.1 hypothetical protein L2B55_10980 [Solitalea lacus]
MKHLSKPRLSIFILVLFTLACTHQYSERQLAFKKLLNNNWVEIKRSNIMDGLYSSIGERYTPDWNLKIDSLGFATCKVASHEIFSKIKITNDSILQWNQFQYRIIKVNQDTLVLQYNPSLRNTINKSHRLLFISSNLFNKSQPEQLSKLKQLTKNDTLFLRRLSDSCRRVPTFHFIGEKLPHATSLSSDIKIDTALFSMGFDGPKNNIEFFIYDWDSNTRYSHAYSGRFIVRENGKIAAFDVGLMTMWDDEIILPSTFNYIKHVVESKVKFEPATTLGVKHNSYVYFTYVRLPKTNS